MKNPYNPETEPSSFRWFEEKPKQQSNMSRKEEILEGIKKGHQEELKRADKFLDLKFAYPLQSRIVYKDQFYLITEVDMFNYNFEATPVSYGEVIDLMDVELSEISPAPVWAGEGTKEG